MATTTTNFGWDIPQSTDLLKDGATAIAALGQDIDTALVDLKGGTTGQVLAKASNTDLDYSWVAQDDSNAIQNAIVDAKGDLIAATAADTPARLAVGTNGQVLTADSTAATGLKWATSSATPTFSGANVYMSADQVIANGTATVLLWTAEYFDSNGYHSTTTNTGRFTVPNAGKYLVIVNGLWNTTANTLEKTIVLRKNATNIYNFLDGARAGSGYQQQAFSYIVDAAANDYFDLTVYQASGGNLNFIGTSGYSNFQISYLGA